MFVFSTTSTLQVHTCGGGGVTPPVVHLEAALTLQTAFGGFLDSTCGCDNGHRNVISSPAHHKAVTPTLPWSLCVPWAAPAWHCSSHSARWRHLLLYCPGSAATRSCASEQSFCGWSSIGWAGLTGQPHPYFCCRPWLAWDRGRLSVSILHPSLHCLS